MKRIQITRRQLLQGAGMVGAGLTFNSLLAACQTGSTTAPAAPGGAAAGATELVNALGVKLPADARPLSEQFIKIGISEVGGAYGHLMESIYNRAFGHAAGTDTLTTLDIDFNVVGVGAESWKISDDGLSWVFNLRKDLVFSSGKPIRAQDWVYTLRHALSNNYDFAWFYFDIKNAQQVANGKAKPEELGIEAVDDYTLKISTEAPVPYLPGLGTWFCVAPENAWTELGDNWALDPKRYVSSGPFTLTQFDRNVANKWELNPKYKGVRRPYLTEIRETNLPKGIPAYIAGDIPTYSISGETPVAEIQLIQANPVLKAEQHPGVAGSTDYLGFNTTGKFKPLDDANVRLALCKAIDKEVLVKEIYQGFSNPAWGILPKGFPNDIGDKLKLLDPNVYDPAAAKALLAKAGFPEGKDFPTFELWVRQPNPKQQALAQAIQARWKENLGIQIEVRAADFQSFTSNLKENAPIYFVGYGLDYYDPATFLNVFRSTGRHPHVDDAWDKFYNAANATLDPKKRFELMAEAETKLVESAAFYFLHSPFSIDLWPCNVKGETVVSNKNGFQFFGGGAPGCPHAYEGIYWSTDSCRVGV
ncbi:hypothetical protein BH10CHL1_BH10CHL1_23350 [soil metagenome]